MPLRILEQSVDGMTGYIHCKVRFEETDAQGNTTQGPDEIMMIDPEALMRAHHAPDCTPCHDSMCNAIECWLEKHHDKIAERKRHIDNTRSAAAAMQGRVLFVGKK